MISDCLYAKIYDLEMDLGGVWDYVQTETIDFDTTRAEFLICLRRLLDDGRIKLHIKGKYLEDAHDKLVTMFDKALPKTVDAILFDDGMRSDINSFYYWFFLKECPACVVWINPKDGSLFWG